MDHRRLQLQSAYDRDLRVIEATILDRQQESLRPPHHFEAVTPSTPPSHDSDTLCSLLEEVLQVLLVSLPSHTSVEVPSTRTISSLVVQCLETSATNRSWEQVYDQIIHMCKANEDSIRIPIYWLAVSECLASHPGVVERSSAVISVGHSELKALVNDSMVSGLFDQLDKNPSIGNLFNKLDLIKERSDESLLSSEETATLVQAVMAMARACLKRRGRLESLEERWASWNL